MIETMSISSGRVTPQELIDSPNLPDIRTVEQAEKTLADFRAATDRSRRFGERVKRFIAGENDLGRGVGKVIDFATIFVPWGDKVTAVRKVVNRKLTNDTMPKMKEPSTKSGLAVIASILALIGVNFDPEIAMTLAGKVITGVSLLVAGVTGLFELFRRERTR